MSNIYFQLACGLTAGILIYEKIGLFFCLLLSFSFISANIITSLIFEKNNKKIIYITLFFMLGAVSSFLSQAYELNGLYPVDNRFVEISGYVYDIPTESNGKYTYIIRTDGAKYKGKIYTAHENILLTCDEKFSYAQNIGVRGFLTPVSKKQNTNSFDYSLYNKSRHIFYTMSAYETATDNSFRHSVAPSFYAKLYKSKVIELIDKYLDGDHGAILKAVTVGFKKDFSEEFSDILYSTNTMRYLYPTYIHICLITALMGILMSFFQKKYRDYATIGAIIIYAMLNFDSHSVIKPVLIAVFTIISVQKLGYKHFPDILSLAVMSILIINPLFIYRTGFIVSIVISWLYFMLRDPLIKKLKYPKKRIYKNLIVSVLISAIGTLPICAYSFNSVSPYAALFNFVFYPLIAAAFGLFPILALELIIFKRAFLIRYIYIFILYALNKLPYIIDKMPFSHIAVPKPSLGLVAAFYIGAVILHDFLLRHTYTKRSKICTAVICCLFCANIFSSISSIGALRIAFVNVGQGDGALITLPKGETVIVDGGGGEEYSDYDAGEKIFLPYLQNEGITKIDYAILSHYHKDHCLGTIAAMKSLSVKNVILPDFYPQNEYRIEIERLAREKGTKVRYVQAGDSIHFSSGAIISILSPNTSIPEDENDSSIVFNLCCNGKNILFTGDATTTVENRISDKLLDVDIVKVPHHGSATSSSENFIKASMPEYALISVGENNTYNLPNDEVVERYHSNGSKVLQTSELGDVIFTISKNGKISYKSLYQEEY